MRFCLQFFEKFSNWVPQSKWRNFIQNTYIHNLLFVLYYILRYLNYRAIFDASLQQWNKVLIIQLLGNCLRGNKIAPLWHTPCFALYLCGSGAILLPLSYLSSNYLLHYFSIFIPLLFAGDTTGIRLWIEMYDTVLGVKT